MSDEENKNMFDSVFPEPENAGAPDSMAAPDSPEETDSPAESELEPAIPVPAEDSVEAEAADADATDAEAAEAEADVADAGAEALAEDLAGDLTEDLAEDLAEDIAEDMTEDLAEDLAEDITEDLAEDLAEDIVEDITEDLAEGIADSLAEEGGTPPDDDTVVLAGGSRPVHDDTLPGKETIAPPDDLAGAAWGDETWDEAAEDVPAPPAAEPPRIVAETPIGGKPRPPARFDEYRVTSRPAAAPDPDEGPVLDAPTQISQPTVAIETPASEETAASEEIAAPETPEPPATKIGAGTPPRPPVSATPASLNGVGRVDAAEWDDDLSPELAQVLFAAGTATETAAAEAPAAPVTAPVDLPAEPVELTDIAQVRSLPLVAEGQSAPAPDAALTARCRYMRIEEPLDPASDRGQRVRETWEYLRTNWPSLGGRLVKEVKAEEITYADGSYYYEYERQYTDRGRDRREVRANRDKTFIERKDEVSKIDPGTEKRVRYRAQAALIFAPPEHEERRGFLSNLFGRDEDGSAVPSVWREATGSEARKARKEGGDAF